MGSIKEVPPEPFEQEFVCKKCGSFISMPVCIKTHKFGAPGMGWSELDVCANCRNGSNLRF